MTLRELVWAAESRIDQAWNHTAAILAMLANVHRDPKKDRAYKPSDFHPTQTARTAKVPPIKGSVALLKSVFVDSLEGKS